MNEMAMYEFAAAYAPAETAEMRQTVGIRGAFTAIVLAGTRSANDPVAAIIGGQYKALVPIFGKPMIERVVEALAASEAVSRIVVVFDDKAMLEDACPSFSSGYPGVTVDVVGCQESICSSVGSAIRASGASWPFVVTTADHALLTPTMVDRFCEEAFEGSSLSVGFVEKRYIDQAQPGSKRTYLPFRDTRLSGANLFAFADEGALPVLDFWRQVETKRKKPWQLFKAFGYRNLFGLLFRRYTVDEAFKRASKSLGLSASAIRLPFAEAAIDVDSPKDYHQVSQILEDRDMALKAVRAQLQAQV